MSTPWSTWDTGVIPEVTVNLNSRRGEVVVADNGRGMDTDGLKHYFTMHGENIERRKGVPGRGKFGTGKSAAFGIGDVLVVDTVRDELRNVVELHREDIKASSGTNVPTRWSHRNKVAPGSTNGTIVTIRGIQQRRIRTEPMIRTFERYLAFLASHQSSGVGWFAHLRPLATGCRRRSPV